MVKGDTASSGICFSNNLPSNGLTGEEIIMETMRKFEKEYSFSTHLIRKYRDTDNRISENDLNENNSILLNSIIKSIKTNG